MSSPLFSIPIPSTNGSITCSNPDNATKTIYLLTFTSGKDNRLTPDFIDALITALDTIEHRFERGVVITTSGIEKFYSNGLDLQLALSTEGFMENYLWRLFKRFLTYPMPTIALLNGHAFAAGLMLGMHHDYRIQNPNRGYLCVNELEFGAPLHAPMANIFHEKLPPTTLRSVILEAKRFGGKEAVETGIVDGVGGLEETIGFVKSRGLEGKAASGVYGTLREEMYRGLLGGVRDHEGNLRWRAVLEGEKERENEMAEKRVRGVKL